MAEVQNSFLIYFILLNRLFWNYVYEVFWIAPKLETEHVKEILEKV